MKESTRIRYTEVNGVLCSKEMFSKHGMVYVMLDQVTKAFSIVQKLDDGTVKVLGNGASKTMATTKKMVKQELKDLGVNFLDEVRKREGAENVEG